MIDDCFTTISSARCYCLALLIGSPADDVDDGIRISCAFFPNIFDSIISFVLQDCVRDYIINATDAMRLNGVHGIKKIIKS